MQYLSELNENQREAVSTVDGALMVIAGAGSGKTRVITSRIAYLIENICAPGHILAVTFTNKAAKEMKERAQKIVGEQVKEVTISTFHALCNRILRKYAYLLNFKNNYVILDEDDSKKYIKDSLDLLDLDSKVYQPKDMKRYISQIKNNEKIEYIIEGDLLEKVKLVFSTYQNILKTDNVLDYDDLIYYTLELFKTNPAILEFYQNKFRYIMIDEFQDTNLIQYELVFLLASKYANVCIVGDQDQSIYSFRGAKVENITRFKEDFKECKLIKLELNYRSSEKILTVANNLIAKNANRIKKTLKPVIKNNKEIVYKRLNNERDEARFIANKISTAISIGSKSYNNFCVLYRNNALSRKVEDSFVSAGIPYVVFGGMSFFQRMEIKDLIAYLRLVVNHEEDFSFKRVINVPKRKLGKETIKKLENFAHEKKISLFEAVDTVDLGQSALNSMNEFRNIIRKLQNKLETEDAKTFIDTIIKETGYDTMLKVTYDDYEARLENLNEFKSVIDEYKEMAEFETNAALFYNLLEDVAIKVDNDMKKTLDNCVTLSTIHQSKGLEFDTVFLIGLEQGLFPSFQSFATPRELEEERRLGYVAITRCKESLFLMNCFERLLYGQRNQALESIFIKEMNLDENSINKNSKNDNDININVSFYDEIKQDIKVGDKINHTVFEKGLVVKVIDDLITVAFKAPHGIKVMMKNHPSISKL